MPSNSDRLSHVRESIGIADVTHHKKKVMLTSEASRLAALFELSRFTSDFLFWLSVSKEGEVQDHGPINGPDWFAGDVNAIMSADTRTGTDLPPGELLPWTGPSCVDITSHTAAILNEAEIARTVAEMAETGEPVSFRMSVQGEKSHEIWQYRLVPAGVGVSDQIHVLGSALNVTTEVHRNERFLETVHSYRRLIDMMPDAISIIDTSGSLRYVNAAAMHLVGARDINDVIGKSYWDFVHPDDTDELRARSRELRDGKPLDVSEYRMLRMDGSVVPVELASVPIKYNGEPAVLGTGRDLSDQHRMQRELLLVSHAVESMDDPVAIFESEGTSIYHNPAFVKTLGYTQTELNGIGGLRMLFEDHDVAREAITSLQAGTSWRGDVQLQAKSGATLAMALRGNVVHTRDGQSIGIVCTFSDISERQEMRQQLITAKEEAEEIARLRSAILTNLTHEVRTPLTVILGFTSMLRQGVKQKYMRFVDLIDRSGRRLLLMLDAILDLAQLEAGSLDVSPEPFNVVDVADGVVSTLQPIARDKGIVLHLEAPDRSVPARLDHRILARILNNLLDNAIKFTNEGSVRVVVDRDDKWVQIAIVDTGVGIEDAFLPHIFDEFSQESTGLERTHQGSGLGLAVSERLITHMGGSIDVQSEKNVGTTFTLRLPANMEE